MERDRYSGGGFLEVGKAAASFCGKAWRRSDPDLLSQGREKLLYCVGGRKGSNFLRGIRRYFFTCFVQDTGTAVAPKSLGEILRYFPMRAILQQFLVLFFHAAQITYQKTGILFAGPSGAGKTTQAKLWERFRNARIICNDRTLLRKQDGNWHSYGYPMDGSQPVRSGEVHVAGCIVLVKQSQNGKSSIERLRAGKAMAQLMPQLVIDWWSENARNQAAENLFLLLKEMPVYQLTATMDEQAVACLEKILKMDDICRKR